MYESQLPAAIFFLENRDFSNLKKNMILDQSSPEPQAKYKGEMEEAYEEDVSFVNNAYFEGGWVVVVVDNNDG